MHSIEDADKRGDEIDDDQQAHQMSRERKLSSSSSELDLTDLDIDNEVYFDSDFSDDDCDPPTNLPSIIDYSCTSSLHNDTFNFTDCSEPLETSSSRCAVGNETAVCPIRRSVPRMGTRLLRRPMDCTTTCDSFQVTRTRLDSDTSAYQTGRDSGSCSPVEIKLHSSIVSRVELTDEENSRPAEVKSTDDVMEWVVHRRSDGSRHITRRPASCSKRRRYRRNRHGAEAENRKQNDVIAEYRRRTIKGASALDTFTTLDELLAFGDNDNDCKPQANDRLIHVTAI